MAKTASGKCAEWWWMDGWMDDWIIASGNDASRRRRVAMAPVRHVILKIKMKTLYNVLLSGIFPFLESVCCLFK